MMEADMAKKNRQRVLFMMTLPPPVHGMSMVCRQIQESSCVNDEFECRYVNTALSRTVEEIGTCGLSVALIKGFRFLGSLLSALKELVCFRPDVCYLAITCHGGAFLKDAPFVLLGKLFSHRVIIHQHNRGMSSCVQRFPYRWLMPLVYRNVTVVLLSQALYEDVSAVVKPEQVRICPNGIQ